MQKTKILFCRANKTDVLSPSLIFSFYVDAIHRMGLAEASNVLLHGLSRRELVRSLSGLSIFMIPRIFRKDRANVSDPMNRG